MLSRSSHVWWVFIAIILLQWGCNQAHATIMQLMCLSLANGKLSDLQDYCFFIGSSRGHRVLQSLMASSLARYADGFAERLYS